MSTPTATASPHTFAHALARRSALRSDARVLAVSEVRAAVIGALCSADSPLRDELANARALGAAGHSLVVRLPTDADAAMQIATALVEEGPRGAARISTEMLTLNQQPAWQHAALASLLALTPAAEHAAVVAALKPTAAECAAIKGVVPWAKHVHFARGDGPQADLLLRVAERAPHPLRTRPGESLGLPPEERAELTRALVSPLLAMFRDPVWQAAFVPALERVTATLRAWDTTGDIYNLPRRHGMVPPDPRASCTLDYCGVQMVVSLWAHQMTLDIPVDARSDELLTSLRRSPEKQHVEPSQLGARAEDPTATLVERIVVVVLALNELGNVLNPSRSAEAPLCGALNAELADAGLDGVRDLQSLATHRWGESERRAVLRILFDPPG